MENAGLIPVPRSAWERPQASAETAPRHRSSPVAVHICLATLALLLLMPQGAIQALSMEAAVWVNFSLLAALAAYGFLTAKRSEDNPWIAPTFLLLAVYTFLFGFGGLVVYYWRFIDWEVLRERYFQAGAGNLKTAAYLASLGGIGLHLGTVLPRARAATWLPSLRWPISETRLRWGIFLAAPAILLAYELVRRGIPLWLDFAALAVTSVVNVMLIIGSYWLFSASESGERIRWGLFLLLTIATGMPTALSTGQMVPLLMPFLMVLCGYVLARRRIPWLELAACASISVLLVLPLGAFYKYAGGSKIPVQDRLIYAWQKYEASDTREKLEISMARTLARFAVINLPAAFSRYYPEVYPYEHGQTFAIELSVFVPRLLWPDKPDKSTVLNRYSERARIIRAHSGTSAVFDAISEYYINFGVAGILAFCILHGWYYSVLYEWMVRQGNFVIGAAMYVALMAGNWDFFGVVNVFESHLKLIPVWILIFYLLSRLVWSPDKKG